MEESNYQDNLNKKYSEVISQIDERRHRYYNLNSIGNFIFHFEELKDQDKEKVFEHIIEYLDLIQEIDRDEVREIREIRKGTRQLSEEYIFPLAHNYYSSLAMGFTPYSRWTVIYAFFIIGLLVLYIIGADLFWYYPVSILFFSYHLYLLYKKSKKRVYGFGY